MTDIYIMTITLQKFTSTAAVAALALTGAVFSVTSGPVNARGAIVAHFPVTGVAEAATLVEIRAVQPGSPAEKAGLKAGDSIIAIDGATVSSGEALAKAVAARKPGDAIRVDVQDRAGAKRTVSVVLGDNPNKSGSAYLGIAFGRSDAQDDRGPWVAAPVTQTVVMAVTAGSPAATAGIKVGDVISAVDGKAITAFDDVSNAVMAKKPGDPLTLDIQTGNAAKRAVVVTLGSVQDRAGVAYLGVRLAAPQAASSGRGKPGRGPSVSGPVMVAEVQPNSPAAKAGVQVGDVIVAINGAALADVKALKASIEAAKIGDTVALKLTRGSESKTLTVTLGENPTIKGKAYLGIGIASVRMPGNRNIPLPGASG